MLELIVAVTLVPAALAAGLALESAQPMPAGAVSMVQERGTFPVKLFKPFTTMVSAMLVPTFVATLSEFGVTVKSLTESVTFVERVRLLSAALTPVIATVAFAAGVVPNVVCRVTVEDSAVTPGVMVGGFAEQVVLPVSAGGNVQPTTMSCVIGPSGVKVTT